MSNVLAGIGRGQLKILGKRIEKKKYIYQYYKNEFEKLPDIELMPVKEETEPNYWLSCIQLKGRIKPINIILSLEKENIESRPLWKPMHMQPYYEDYDFIGEGVAENIFLNGVCLPSDTKMTDDDLERITENIKSLWQ
jgi:dTDP-4-amino-4,6-dideoxygalactose transaminase